MPTDFSVSSETRNSLTGVQQKVLLLLCIASFLGHLTSIPLSLSLAHSASTSRSSGFDGDWIAVVSNLLLSTAFTILVMIAGFRAGRRVGLGWPILAGLEQPAVDLATAKRATLTAVLLGLLSSCNAALLDVAVGALLPEATIPTPGPGLLSLASVGAAINEEIICRLGFMTILVWIFTALTHRQKPEPVFVWSGIVLSSLAFASLHLPQAIALYGIPTIPILIAVFGGNGIPGILFGWLYWKKGIIAAMIAHFTADILIYGLIPAMSL